MTGKLGRWRNRQACWSQNGTGYSKYKYFFSVSVQITLALIPIQSTKKKSSKRLEEKIAEKERKSREEAEAKRLLAEANMTPEERIAEKLRRQKMVEDADFELAKETFGELIFLKSY